MQSKARVAPRNIQFKNDVQIREIPSRNAEDKHTVDDDAWDPNLTEVSLFSFVFNADDLLSKDAFIQKPTKQRNVVVVIAVCGLVLLGVIIGTVLGIVLSQSTSTVSDQSLSYNGACTVGSNQCKSSQGLYCPNGFCTCTSPYSWNSRTTSCKTRILLLMDF